MKIGSILVFLVFSLFGSWTLAFSAGEAVEAKPSSFNISDRKLMAKISYWKHRLEVDPRLENMPRKTLVSPPPAVLPAGVTVHHQFMIEEEPRTSSS